ncbi:MAG TPA: alpha/beta fold hydrolase [Thermoanaerobaculaceae bacterium]|nr:alpha/beta fold hydrolase [Thermoanaerobaculaceae bacterium]
MRVEVGEIALEVEDHGEGVPVVLLHGFPLSSAMWTGVRTAVEQVARLVTPDLRGFGGSDKPASGYTMEALADDVVRLADRIGLARFVLGGHSMGGYVALRVAAAHPERLAGLILVDTRAEADAPEARARRAAAIARIEGGEAAAWRDEFVANLVGATTRARAPRLLAELRADAADVPAHALAGCLAGMRDRADSTALLAGLAVPALVIAGEEDAITPPASARALAAAIPKAELVLIPQAGHTPSVERPIPTAEALMAFLRDHFPPPAAAIRPRLRPREIEPEEP